VRGTVAAKLGQEGGGVEVVALLDGIEQLALACPNRIPTASGLGVERMVHRRVCA
jgi:hypothetical protein